MGKAFWAKRKWSITLSIQPILETIDLEFTYPDGTKALKGISVKINQGEKIAVLGVNGAGKSTLFLNFNGINRPTGGKLYFKGREVKYNHSALIDLRKSVGIVFQDPDTQLFSANVYQEVSFGAINLKLPQEVVKQRVDAALTATGTWEIRNKPVHFLSYGQKKRVSIADILVMEPDVIILDEPTASLDPLHTLRMMELFNNLNKEGKAIILSTHDVDAAYEWADTVWVMKDGKILKTGNWLEIFRNEELLTEAELIKPMVLNIFDKLVKAGKCNSCASVPRNSEQLTQVIMEGV